MEMHWMMLLTTVISIGVLGWSLYALIIEKN
ncbi:hypothetical protein HNR44_002780 [Geomicrobium halophilum]|uniref:Uncharacterized protein n=1 Tax=Geomicrobium halophilum TaxID=549000 RepID=A0A841PPU5_9BACL|nr:hypothetical protein [Geomicrobium halophilum]